MSGNDMLRRGDVLKAIQDALVVNPARDEARKLAGYVVSALPAVQPHVNETPKSEHDARDVLTPATKGGDA